MLSVSYQRLFIWSTQKLYLADLHKIAAAKVQEELLPASMIAISTSLGDHAFFKIQDSFSGAFQQRQVADMCVIETCFLKLLSAGIFIKEGEEII